MAAVLRASGGESRVLICRRPANSIRGGLWEFPGGKLEPGESPAQGAAREVLEETALRLDPSRALPVCELDHHEPDAPAERRLYFYLLAFAASPDAVAQPLASTECTWETLTGLDRYEWPRANRVLIERLREWMAKQARR